MHAVITGGMHTVVRRNELESAAAGPCQTWGGEFLYPTLYLMAAALLRSLSENQCFSDGNKRVAWVATLAFLDINGYIVEAPVNAVVDMMLKVATHEFDVPEIADFLESFTSGVHE